MVKHDCARHHGAAGAACCGRLREGILREAVVDGGLVERDERDDQDRVDRLQVALCVSVNAGRREQTMGMGG